MRPALPWIDRDGNERGKAVKIDTIAVYWPTSMAHCRTIQQYWAHCTESTWCRSPVGLARISLLSGKDASITMSYTVVHF
jgi:hypothetical protein